MSGTLARSLGALGDALGGTANANFDAGTLFIDGVNNNVGVGTTSPQALFHIERNLAGEVGHFVNNPNAGGYAAVRIGNNDRATNGDHLIYGSAVLGIRSKTGAAITFEPAGTERMRIDTSGRITKPFQPAFYIQHTGGGGINQQDTTVILNNPLLNRGSAYSTSTGRYTCPVAGLYQVFFGTIKSDNGVTPDGRVSRFRIRRNGVNVSTELRLSEGGGYGDSASMVCMVECAANDFIDVYLSDIGGWYGAVYAHFGGFLIG